MVRSWCLTSLLTLNTLFVPRVAIRLGWATNFRFYGYLTLVVAAIWQAFAADRPSQWRFGMTAEEQTLLDSIGTESLQRDDSTPQKHKQHETAIGAHTESKQHIGTAAGGAENQEEMPVSGVGRAQDQKQLLTMFQLLSIPNVRALFIMPVISALSPTPTGSLGEYIPCPYRHGSIQLRVRGELIGHL